MTDHEPSAELAASVGFRLKASNGSCISVSKSVECVPLLGLRVSKMKPSMNNYCNINRRYVQMYLILNVSLWER